MLILSYDIYLTALFALHLVIWEATCLITKDYIKKYGEEILILEYGINFVFISTEFFVKRNISVQ